MDGRVGAGDRTLASLIEHVSEVSHRASSACPFDESDRDLLCVLAVGANMTPPLDDDDAATLATIDIGSLAALYVPFFTALQSIEDAHPGAVTCGPWPPTPLSVRLCVVHGPQGAAERLARGDRFAAPYDALRSYALAASSWDALAASVEERILREERDARVRRWSHLPGEDAACLFDGDAFALSVTRTPGADPTWCAALDGPVGICVGRLVARPDDTAGAASPAVHWYDDDNEEEDGGDDGNPHLRGSGGGQTTIRAEGMVFEYDGMAVGRVDPTLAPLDAIYRARRRSGTSLSWPTVVCAFLYAAIESVAVGDPSLCLVRMHPTGSGRTGARLNVRALAAALAAQLADPETKSPHQ